MTKSHEHRHEHRYGPANLPRRRAIQAGAAVLLTTGGFVGGFLANSNKSPEPIKVDARVAVAQRIREDVGHRINILGGLVSSNFTHNGITEMRAADSQLLIEVDGTEYSVYAPDTFDFASDTVPLSDELIINEVTDPNSIPKSNIQHAVLEANGTFVDAKTGKMLEGVAQAHLVTQEPVPPTS